MNGLGRRWAGILRLAAGGVALSAFASDITNTPANVYDGPAKDLHIDQNKNMDGKNFPHLRRALEAYPKCVFIAHALWWLQFPDGTCDRMLQEYPNLYTDTSGHRVGAMLNRDRAYTREFLIRNANKVMFGSDAGPWSIRDGTATEVQFEIFQRLDLPDDVKTKIYRTNAEKVFGLRPKL